MKSIIVYNSKTGFTTKYAKWLHQAITSDIIEYSEIKNVDFKDYKYLIFGACIKAGKINGIDEIIKIAEANNIELIVFEVGATPITEEEAIRQTKQANFGDTNITNFYFPGGMAYDKLPFAERMIIKMMSKMMKKHEPNTAIDLSKSFDNTDEKYIQLIIDYINQ